MDRFNPRRQVFKSRDTRFANYIVSSFSCLFLLRTSPKILSHRLTITLWTSYELELHAIRAMLQSHAEEGNRRNHYGSIKAPPLSRACFAER